MEAGRGLVLLKHVANGPYSVFHILNLLLQISTSHLSYHQDFHHIMSCYCVVKIKQQKFNKRFKITEVNDCYGTVSWHGLFMATTCDVVYRQWKWLWLVWFKLRICTTSTDEMLQCCSFKEGHFEHRNSCIHIVLTSPLSRESYRIQMAYVQVYKN